MDENNTRNEKVEKNSGFKTVSSPNPYNGKKTTKNSGFGKSVMLPFFSGVLGCSVVIGTCFGVPSIRSKILDTNSNY